MEREIEHALSNDTPGSRKSVTYRFKSSAGVSLYITLTFDEFYVIEGMIINQGASGTSMHNVCNALGRVISLGIQEIRKSRPERLYDFIMKQAANLEGFSSEVLWLSDDLGNAQSIPDVLSLILKRHVEIAEAIDDLHSGEEDED
jgi:hypothetical protein